MDTSEVIGKLSEFIIKALKERGISVEFIDDVKINVSGGAVYLWIDHAGKRHCFSLD